MREIKFRAWNKVSNKMFHDILVSGRYVLQKYCDMYGNWSTKVLDDINDASYYYIPMQYTGLLDKNGKEVYESDIIKEKDYLFIVKWQSGGFVLSPIKYYKSALYIGRQIVDIQNAAYISESCEVIGNVYEHSHLLDNKGWAKW